MARLSDPVGDTTDRWAVWPDGSQEVYRDAALGNGVLFDGDTILPGDPIAGIGRLVELADIPGGGEGGGYWRSSGTYCGALKGGVLIIDELRRA